MVSLGLRDGFSARDSTHSFGLKALKRDVETH